MKAMRVAVFRGTGRRHKPVSADVIPIKWFSTDRDYAAEYGPNVRGHTLDLQSPLDLLSLTGPDGPYEQRRTVAEWVQLLNRLEVPVRLLDMEYADADVPLWDLLRGAELVGVEHSTSFGDAILSGPWDSIIWYERASDMRPVVAIGVL